MIRHERFNVIEKEYQSQAWTTQPTGETLQYEKHGGQGQSIPH